MKKIVSVLSLASIFVAGLAFASGYRLPEQSVNSVSKAGANIASADHPDAAYFNPANMSWLVNGWLVEGDLQYVHLFSIDYEDSRTSDFDGSSNSENYLLPKLFFVSPTYNNLRIGFSITEPFGLESCWDDPYPATFSKKFSLEVIEFNPTVSYKINNTFSIAGGVRFLDSSATLYTDGIVGTYPGFGGIAASRYMTGDGNGWGYNLAISAKPDRNSNISVTYRSEVDLDLSGNVSMQTNFPFPTTVSTSGEVTVVTPAVLAISGSYTFWDKLTVDLTWDRTFWSAYEDLDFTYNTQIGGTLQNIYGVPIEKNFKDSNSYRIGFSYQTTKTITLMAGLGYDETPAPSDTLGFDLADSNAVLSSLGARYQITSQLDLGVGMFYGAKTSRTVNNLAEGGQVAGKFTNNSAYMCSVALTYKF